MPAEPVVRPPRPRVSPSVLVVEPDADMAWLARLALRRVGFRVVTAASAAEAGARAAAEGPVVVVIDTDTVSLRLVVAALEAALGPRPLVLLVGPREPTYAARGRFRISARLRKPFGAADLVAAVRGALVDAGSA